MSSVVSRTTARLDRETMRITCTMEIIDFYSCSGGTISREKERDKYTRDTITIMCAKTKREREIHSFLQFFVVAQTIFTLSLRSPASPSFADFSLCVFLSALYQLRCVTIRGSGFTRGKFRSIYRGIEPKLTSGFSRRTCRSQPIRPFQFYLSCDRSFAFFFSLSLFFHMRSHPNNREFHRRRDTVKWIEVQGGFEWELPVGASEAVYEA